MKTAVIVASVAVLAAPAFAEYRPYAVNPDPAPGSPPPSDRGYLGGGAGLTIDHFLNAYLDLEGALRIADLPLWVRGAGALGKSADVEGGGDFKAVRVGLEARSCRESSTSLCGYLGIDAGAQTQTWSKQDEMTEHHRGFVYGARFGLDAGGDRTRFRLGLELYNYVRSSDVDQLPDESARGGGLTLAVIHRM